jgi:hypothetical protein
MRIIIAGSRNFNDYLLLKETMLPFTSKLDIDTIEIISGGARGADKLGEIFAKELNYKLKLFSADWSLGKHAGYLRNKQMADYGDALVAFWDGESKGTKMMIELAKTKKLKIKVIKY